MFSRWCCDDAQVTITENIAVGTTVVRVAANDLDLADNAAVRYFLSASSQAAYGDVFAVDEISGDVIVTGQVDRERAAVYHVMVGARDTGAEPLVAEATVVIRVDDENDNAPTATVNTLTSSDTEVANVFIFTLRFALCFNTHFQL